MEPDICLAVLNIFVCVNISLYLKQMFKIGSQVEIVRNRDLSTRTPKAFFNAGDNTGNLLFTYGILSFLDPDNVTVEEIPGKPSDYFDLIIFALANLIQHVSNDKLYRDMLHIVQTYTCPFLVFGLGSQVTAADFILDHSPLLIQLLQALSTCCHTLFVRDDNTQEILTYLNIHNTAVCGCPSILLNSNHELGNHIVKQLKAPSSVSICTAYQSFEWVEKLLPRWPRILQEPSDLLVQHPVETNLFFDLRAWCTYLETKEICIGPRIHGTIASLMVERLGINICHDVRTRGLCATMQLPSIDIKDVHTDIEQMIPHIQFDPIAFTLCRQRFAQTYLTAFQRLNVPLSSQLTSIINGSYTTKHLSIIDRHVRVPIDICLPPNFDVRQYKVVNPDICHLSDLEAEIHYERHGYKENRMFTHIKLPLEFNPLEYRRWNTDLYALTETQLTAHYLTHGHLEKRVYEVIVPAHFDLRWYRHWNPDIADESDNWLQRHYMVYGQTEGRLCQYTLPLDFDTAVYRWYNRDLMEMSDLYLQRHYQLFGHLERRLYRDPWFDKWYFIRMNRIESYRGHIEYSRDIRQAKSQCATAVYATIQSCPGTIVLVSHENSLYGATHYLYLLCLRLRAQNQKVVVVDTYPNLDIQHKYNLPPESCYYYHHDPTILYWICQKLQPKLIYINSLNTTITQVLPWLDREKVCLHSHEIRAHYTSSYRPDMVVSTRIAAQYDDRPHVQPPIVDIPFVLSHQNHPVQPLTNTSGKILGEHGRLILGMSGSLTERKNYKLFLEVAEQCLEYDFLWIGGTHALVTSLSNVFHIQDVRIPYSYYTLLDYFVLFSLEDPCPYVVLENLLLGTRVLTFRDNIYTKHIVPGQYFEFQGGISLQTAMSHIRSICRTKRPIIVSGRKYIEKNYTSLTGMTISRFGGYG